MRSIFIIVVSLAFQVACTSSAQQRSPEQIKAERKLFQKSPYEIKQPGAHSLEEKEDGTTYDPKPRVVSVSEKSGKYEFRWIGYDGKEKIVAYQRHDAIDAVVEAEIGSAFENKLLYKYSVKVLASSPIYLNKFLVQTFAPDVAPVQTDSDKRLFYAGTMTNLISFFKVGSWKGFGFVGEDDERIYAGKAIIFQLSSSSLPGIVRCKVAGGELGTMGVGEDLPPALEREIPIFQDYADGYTVGPIESLSGLSKPARARYVLENLPKFQEAGWMSEGTAKIYESLLLKDDLEGSLKQAKRDLVREFVTREVFLIIEGLNNGLR